MVEYAKQGIRFNAVAPGVVDTPMHEDGPKDALKALQPMGKWQTYETLLTRFSIWLVRIK